jgi:hypothetical protein
MSLSLDFPSMSRRTFTGGLAGTIATALGGGALLSLPASRALATQTPAASADLGSLGLPTLDITINADSFDGGPTETAAGRYLVNATLGTGAEPGMASVMFVQPPAGMSAEEFLNGVMSAVGGPSASPAASPDASASPEAGGEEEMVLPTFIYQAHFAGGIYPGPDAPGQVVVDLPPGEWILIGDDPTSPQTPVIFTATGDMPSDLPEPASDIDVTLIEFAISIDGSLTAGDHLLRVENQGAEPHFLFLAKGPDELTDDMVSAIFSAEMGGGTPPAIPFDPETALQPVLETSTQSIGTVQWTPVTLEAGTYLAACFFPTAGEGLPHAAHGMHTVFTVS